MARLTSKPKTWTSPVLVPVTTSRDTSAEPN
jgi:hypothetical protein